MSENTDIGSKVNQILAMQEKHGKKLDCLDGKVNSITHVLGGSGMGDRGLVEQMTELKKYTYKKTTEHAKEISAFKIYVGIVSAGISAIFASIVSLFVGKQ